MLTRKQTIIGLALAFGLTALVSLAVADDAGKDSPLLIIDGAGKEQKVKAWKFAVGTRHLTWLAPADKPAAEPKEKEKEKEKAPVKAPVKAARPAVGPQALEFREEHSTNFVDGILTLIPLARIRAIEYDNEKQTVSVKVVSSEKADDDEVLTGATRFRGINKLTIEAEVDKGELGVAELKFLGGFAKGGIRSLAFPKPMAAAAAPVGRPATITIADKEKAVQKVTDLQPLYRLPDGSERLLPTLMFKKTLKIDVAKVQKIHVVDTSGKGDDGEWVVTLKDGEENTLTLLKTIPVGDRQATLEGLLGRVPAGYKLYPIHTVADIVFDEVKKE